MKRWGHNWGRSLGKGQQTRTPETKVPELTPFGPSQTMNDRSIAIQERRAAQRDADTRDAGAGVPIDKPDAMDFVAFLLGQ